MEGRVTFASFEEARRWIQHENIQWSNFWSYLESNELCGFVLQKQLALPQKILKRIIEAMSAKEEDLPRQTAELRAVFEKYADFQSVYSGSEVGRNLLNAGTKNSQLAALGGLACILGIPAHQLLDATVIDDEILSTVLSGYAIGRELNIVRRTDIFGYEERMERAIEKVTQVAEEAHKENKEAKSENARLIDAMTAQAENRESTWTQFFESARNEWTNQRTTVDVQLRLQAPATYWRKKAQRTFWGAMISLIVFVLIAAGFIWAVVVFGPTFLKTLTSIENDGGYASLAIVSLPALTALWGLRHVARLFMTNFELSTDAKMRETMATTFLALTREGASTAKEEERLLVLEALFRPPGSSQKDDGHFGGALEILTRRDGQR